MDRPAIVYEKLTGDNEGRVQKAASDLNVRKAIESGPAPNVEILNLSEGDAFEDVQEADPEERKIPVIVQVTDVGGGIGRVEWRVGSERQIHRQELVGLEDVGASRKLMGMVPVEHPTTFIEVTAFNSRNLVSSRANVTVSVEADSDAQIPSLYVVAVGVSDYLNDDLDLPSPKWDVLGIKHIFEQSEASLFKSVEVVDLIDEDATIDRIGNAFAELGPKVHPRDSFVFFVSAHGENVDGDLYVLPGDYIRSQESLTDAIKRQGFGRTHIQEWFQNISARRRIEIYDVCDAASLAGTPKFLKKGVNDEVELNYFAHRMKNATGNVYIFASQPEQEAIDGYAELDYSLFTYAFLEAFVTGDRTRDKRIDLIELRDHLRIRVPELALEVFGQTQNTQLPEVVPNQLPNESDYFLGSKVAVIPKFEEQRAAEKQGFSATHIVRVDTLVENQLAGQGRSAELKEGTWVAVVSYREDGMVEIRTQDGKILGWVDPKVLESIPGRPVRTARRL
jgi:hypothetical protein